MHTRVLFLAILCTKASFGVHLEIGNLPATVSIHEDAAGSAFLYSVVSYPKAASCSLDGSTPNFQIASASDQHTISTIASPTFDHGATPTYNVVVVCTDSGESQTATLTVSILENVAPAYTNIPGAITISAKTVKANHVIYSVSYTDADSDPPLTYSNLATTPTSGPFSISGDLLKVTADLLSTTVTFYRVDFDVTDGRTSTSSYINVTINDINTAPFFVGVTDVNVTAPEILTTGRQLLFDIDFSDAEADPIQYTFVTASPNSNVFDLVGATGEIYLIGGNTLDFETLPNEFVFNVLVSDPLLTSLATFTVTIRVTNVNEAPTYTGTPNAVTIDEAATGTVVGTPSALCTDPDGTPPDVISYSILFSTYSAYFSIDSTTAQVTLAQDWDYDSLTLPKSVNLTIRCSDIDGVSDDATYSVSFSDINDNDPVCTPATTTYYLYYNQTVNATITNIMCTDADSTSNAELNYTEVGLDIGYGTFYFDVDTNGNVSISNMFNMTINTTFYVTILVTDNGTPSRSATVTLTVTYTEEPIIITYNNTQPCFLCTSGTITTISTASLIAFMLLVFGIVLVVLRACYAYERWKILRALSKKKKKKWRIFGCCRPQEKKKPKKSKEEIQRAEKADREYMRARNALLGAEDPQRGIDTQWRKEVKMSTFERLRMQFLGKTVAEKSKRSGPTVATLPPEVTFRGREKTPAGTANIAPGIDSLTTQERINLTKFKQMKNTTGEKGSQGPSTSSEDRRQPASDMVWTFHGRDK